MGFSSFIVGDMALLVFLKKNLTVPAEIHVSGEMSESNHIMIDEMRSLGAKRIIFHRKVTPQEMKSCIDYQKMQYPKQPLEYEAFALNELCHFTGAFCSSLHCDELAPACRLPYRLIRTEQADILNYKRQPDQADLENAGENFVLGQSGCGLCALWQLRDAGITHIKLVSRGNYTADTIEDIRQLKNALNILEQSACEKDYKKQMKSRLFANDCSHNCYYITEN